MKYIIDGNEYDVVIEKKMNKNSYIRIKDDLRIHVSTSYLATKNAIEKMLDENYSSLQDLVNKKLRNMEKKQMFFYLGQSYDIIELNIIDDVELDGSRIYVKNHEQLKKWYQNEIKKILGERFKYNCQLFAEGAAMPTLKIRKMKTRWGVYNRANHSVTLNSHLIEYSIESIDYVIIHELSHIIHFDHSKEFWNLVSKYCPNYKRIRKELKE